jgi:hypothetical protein
MSSNNPTTKIDLRYNNIVDAVTEISLCMKKMPLTDEAVAVLVVAAGSGINKTQVLNVLRRLRELENKYVKPEFRGQ